MLSAITDDLDVIFSTSDFSEVVVYTPSGGAPTQVEGIFDDEDIEAGEGEFSQAIVSQIKFQCRTSDVPSPSENDTVKARGTTYYVANTKDDGTGITTLYLSGATL